MAELTQTEAYAVGGFLAGSLAIFAVFAILFYVLLVIATWKIFTKAGEAGWKSLIPIYNAYVFFKICKMTTGWFWGFLVASILSGITSVQWLSLIGTIGVIVISVYAMIKLADAFGKGTGFKVGLIFLPNIFTLILGFGSAEYQK